MKFGITGSAGFIGSFITTALRQDGHEVLSLDQYVYSPAKSTVKLKTGGFDWILHFGASTSVDASFNNPTDIYKNNIESTLSALGIASHTKAAFLFMSSFVYGQSQYLPLDEKHPISPTNPYMGSKICGEQVCEHWQTLFDLPVIILRGFNIYGNANIPGRLISDLLNAVKENKPLVVNDPLPKRDYLYIEDFNNLIEQIVTRIPIKTGIYNVGCGESYSNLDVAEYIKRISGAKQTIEVRPAMRKNDIADCSVDVSLVKNTFHWQPLYTLEEGLKKVIQTLN